MQTETSRGPLTGPEGDGPVLAGGPRWRALLEMRWRARLQEVTELALAYHEAAAAAASHGTGGGDGGPQMRRLLRLLQRTVTSRRALADPKRHSPACRPGVTAGAKAARAPSGRSDWPPCPRPATAPGAPGGGADDRAALGLGRLCRLRGRGAGPITTKNNNKKKKKNLTEACAWSAVWVALGLGFGGLLWVWRGGDIAQAYLARYLIEKSLSLDNVFVFTVIFAMFAIPLRYQHRVLMAGIIGALGLRAAFIAGGAALLHSFHVIVYVFGALLLWTAIRMLRSGGHLQPGRGLPRVIQRILPTTSQLHGQRFLVREGGRWLATPLLAALIVVEAADVIFAVDSIPAIFAVTTDTFVVFTSNVFALLGLRALYFLLAGAVGRLRYLRPALSIVLAAAAAKLLLSDVYTIPVWVSPAFILSVLAVAAALSLWDAHARPAAGPRTGPAAAPALPRRRPALPRRSSTAPATPARRRAAPPTRTPRPAMPRTRPAPALNRESPVREGSGPGRERDEAANDVNTVYSKQ